MPLLILFYTVLFLLISFLAFLVAGIFFGAPYVGTDKKRIEEILKLANIRKGETAVDLGSGDGRIVIAMAKKGAIAHGYEINPWYVLFSKIRVIQEGVHGKAFIHWRNFWNVNVSEFDIVTVYGVSYIMKKLEIKLKKELKRGARVISSSYSLKNWKPSKRSEFVFLYKK